MRMLTEEEKELSRADLLSTVEIARNTLVTDAAVLETEKLRARIKKLEQEKEILEQRIAGLYWLVDNKCRS